jgi:hypothetical protein
MYSLRQAPPGTQYAISNSENTFKYLKERKMEQQRAPLVVPLSTTTPRPIQVTIPSPHRNDPGSSTVYPQSTRPSFYDAHTVTLQTEQPEQPQQVLEVHHATAQQHHVQENNYGARVLDSHTNGVANVEKSKDKDTSNCRIDALYEFEEVEMSPDHDAMGDLLSGDSDDESDSFKHDKYDDIRHAPLLDAAMIHAESELFPQFGLLGSHNELDTKSRMFLNTNTPFSAFICGVQGSGKSHTTACILENMLVPSKNLGRLQKPLSALVFSYGHFSGDGAGFNISEAAFLGSSNPRYPHGAHVKKINVLVSPSNFVRISKLYLRLPNVSVTRFVLNPRNLDIDTMLTLMSVNESDEQPLYMAQVIQILRVMATTGAPFNYIVFKNHLKAQKFNPAQVNMLQIRLNLLESFLDLKGDLPKPEYRAGEITIMDMSCPFVDANTACILFRIGLTQYLDSKVAGKVIILDEAHKVSNRILSS